MPAEDIDDDRPEWERVAAGIRAKVVEGKPGDRLPSISQLSAEYGVGLTTVKMALNHLRASGEVRTKRGQGTYIPGPPPSG